MKIRYDFVTNSSSSSFILGEPGVASGRTKEDVLNDIKSFCDNIIIFRDALDEKVNKHEDLYRSLLDARKLYIEHNKAFENKDKNTWDYFSKYLDKREEVLNSKEFWEELQTTFAEFECKLSLNIDDFDSDSISFYFEEEDVNKLKGIEEILKDRIYDFKEPLYDANMELFSVLTWYNDYQDYGVDIKEDIYSFSARNRKDLDYNKVAFKYLGEFGIYGIDNKSLPVIVVYYLAGKARLACNHMG